jgi:hypothetical protein
MDTGRGSVRLRQNTPESPHKQAPALGNTIRGALRGRTHFFGASRGGRVFELAGVIIIFLVAVFVIGWFVGRLRERGRRDRRE